MTRAPYLPLLALAALAPAQSSVESVVAAAERAGVRVGCVVRDVDAGKSWYRHRSGEAFIPASNQKLMTVAAFLHRLGTDYRFRTGFSVANGELVIHAGGDPNWITDGPHDPSRMFAEVATRLTEAGIGAVRRIRLDAGAFRGDTRPSGWPSDQFERAYAAPTGGVLTDAGCFKVRVRPGSGKNASIEVLAPPGGFPVRGAIRMTKDKKKGSVWGIRQVDDRLQAFGALWTKSRGTTMRAAVVDAEATFVRACERALEARGVRVAATAAARSLDRFDLESTVATALRPVLADSSNVHAEQLVRVLGAERAGKGTFDAGCAEVLAAVRDLCGELPSEIAAVDGSGLSRGNRLRPDFVVTLLEAVLRSPFVDEFLDALPQGGVDGTLRRRFTGAPLKGRVRAKTGTIRRVSALSGVVRDRGGRLHAFSILMNVPRGKSVSARRMRGWQDGIVTAIHGRGDGVR